MGSYIAKWVGKKLVQDKILKERLENKFGVDDPYFEQVPATRLNGTPSGKFKKIRKAVPPGLSDHDAEVLNKVKRRAYRLDMAFGSFMGIKLGWGSLIGLFPIFGDFGDALLGLLVVRTAKQIEGGLPSSLLLSMYFWVFVDLIIGLIPFIGDIADAMVLANTRNAAALEAYLRKKGKKNLRASGRPVPENDPSDPAEFDRLHNEPLNTPQRGANNGPDNQLPSQHGPQQSGVVSTEAASSRPVAGKASNARHNRSSGWFSAFGSRKSRPTDVETGLGSAGQATPANQRQQG
ncbi:hypothetical protein GGS20DRAFT_526581 [Poronia punctata]|nr:hypothetical protein GGS20DRAFT_526581 [Poronia punctata]